VEDAGDAATSHKTEGVGAKTAVQREGEKGGNGHTDILTQKAMEKRDTVTLPASTPNTPSFPFPTRPAFTSSITKGIAKNGRNSVAVREGYSAEGLIPLPVTPT
jgi:hypothetical protein